MQPVKKWISLLFFSMVALTSMAQHYIPIDPGSSIKFTIRNLGIGVTGSFTGIKGEIVFNEVDLVHSSFMVSVDTKTIDTDIKARDNHLREEAYFDVARYPTMSFTSRKIVAQPGAGNYQVSGILQIKGVSREISFPFTTTQVEGGLIFKGNVKINRRDFGVGGKSLILSDNLTINLAVMARKN